VCPLPATNIKKSKKKKRILCALGAFYVARLFLVEVCESNFKLDLAIYFLKV
jgi:hypothetical protein